MNRFSKVNQYSEKQDSPLSTSKRDVSPISDSLGNFNSDEASK